MTGGLAQLARGPSAENVQVAQQALTSAPCLKFNNVRVSQLTCSEVAGARQLSNEPSNVENGAGSRPGHAKLQGLG